MPKIQGIHSGGTIGQVIDRPTTQQLAFVLPCNGAAVSRTTYAKLFAVIGTTHGEGDGSTTFNVPDGRGRFRRGIDEGTGRDPDVSGRTAANPGGATGDNVGSIQGHAFQTHDHPTAAVDDTNFRTLNIGLAGGVDLNDGGATATTVGASTALTIATRAASGAHAQASSNESRPVNGSTKFWIIWK